MEPAPASVADMADRVAGSPGDPTLRFAMANLLLQGGNEAGAVAALQETVRLNPRHDAAWLMLAGLLQKTGDREGADRANRHAEQIHHTAEALQAAIGATHARHPEAAEHILLQVQKAQPDDSTTLRLLADVCERTGRPDHAEMYVTRALEAWPDCDGTLHHLAILYYRHNKLAESAGILETLRARDPENAAYISLSALVDTQLGRTQSAVDRLRGLLKKQQAQPEIWRSLGHAFKAQGDQRLAETAYHKAWTLRPDFASACWALANLKTYTFSDEDVAHMQAMSHKTLPRTEEAALHFALGKALSDRADYPAAFQHYAKGNALRHAGTPWHTDRHHQLCKELAALPAPEAGTAPQKPVPVFIVGLPRSGSTLLEQMLASHSAIEGTMELPDIPMLAQRLCGPDVPLTGQYADRIRALTPEDCESLGAEYLARTDIQRTEKKPYFIDKRPDNFLHIPLITRILPGAKIIDIRRHAMACGFSCYAQLFAGGHAFSYDLTTIGRYYTDYVALTDRLAQAMPERVLHLRYEDLIADPETQIRRVLTFCGLPYEEACLNFYQNKRAVRTASAAQVRQPLHTGGLDHWRHFAQWLEPLRAALGPGIAKN